MTKYSNEIYTFFYFCSIKLCASLYVYILVLCVMEYSCIRQIRNDDLYFSILQKTFTYSVSENLTSVVVRLNTVEEATFYTLEICINYTRRVHETPAT